jgi:LruC domain-containing protein
MTELVIDPTFDYATTHQQAVTLRVADPEGQVVARAKVRLYAGNPAAGSALLATGQTDASGQWTTQLQIPTHHTDLVVKVDYPGMPDAYHLDLTAGSQSYLLGGQAPGEAAGVSVFDEGAGLDGAGKRTGTDGVPDKIAYLGTYNQEGVPTYLTLSPDVVSQDLLDLVANSLPESYPVPTYNPDYIASTVSADTRLRDSAELWVTFVHEGAGYRNVLGYYAYDLATPPSSVDDIDSLRIIFPNVSFKYSGGGLTSGDKVYLGSFPANTGIGWFLIPNGWSSGSRSLRYPGTGAIKFSDKNLNTFTAEAYRSHVVLLKDDARELLLLGIEDIDRPGGDNDFNDAVFYVTASPYTAIETGALVQAHTASGPDDDNDQVTNSNDAYPNDPDRAFDLYFPGENTYGTIAFEDLWPYRGDYDLNDVVVDYSYHLTANTANRIVSMEATLIVKALGAGMSSGFGFCLGIDPSEVSRVTGSQILDNRVTLAANGLESGQSQAVVIAFDDGHQLMQQGEGRFVNTEMSSAYITPDTLRINLVFNTPQRLNDLGSAPFNPFIFTGRGRGYEVHLPNFPPTDLVDVSLFRTGNDDSDPVSDRYYKDSKHLPWAIHVPSPFSYPTERTPIIQGHLRFASWAQSAGVSYTDWYLSQSGYRNSTGLYSK